MGGHQRSHQFSHQFARSYRRSPLGAFLQLGPAPPDLPQMLCISPGTRLVAPRSPWLSDVCPRFTDSALDFVGAADPAALSIYSDTRVSFVGSA